MAKCMTHAIRFVMMYGEMHEFHLEKLKRKFLRCCLYNIMPYVVDILVEKERKRSGEREVSKCL